MNNFYAHNEIENSGESSRISPSIYDRVAHKVTSNERAENQTNDAVGALKHRKVLSHLFISIRCRRAFADAKEWMPRSSRSSNRPNANAYRTHTSIGEFRFFVIVYLTAFVEAQFVYAVMAWVRSTDAHSPNIQQSAVVEDHPEFVHSFETANRRWYC